MKWGGRRRQAADSHILPPDADPDAMFASALELIQSGQEDAGLRLLKPLADAGISEAAVIVGVILVGNGDYDAAEPLLRGLAAQGNPECMYQLGSLSRKRDKDEAAARRWFLGGASLAHTPSMFQLGTAALKDNELMDARYWLGRAAVAGDAEAMSNLGVALRASGDLDGARLWWQRAADHGDQLALRNLRLTASA
jgi:TPR repeat protein